MWVTEKKSQYSSDLGRPSVKIKNLESVIDLKNGYFFLAPDHLYKVETNKVIPLNNEPKCLRSEYKSFRLSPNKVVLYGGGVFLREGCSKEIFEILDINTFEFTPFFSDEFTLFRPTAIPIDEQKILFISGFNERVKDLSRRGDKLWLYDVSKRESKLVGLIKAPRLEPDILKINNEEVLIIGGGDGTPSEEVNINSDINTSLIEKINLKNFKSKVTGKLKYNRPYSTGVIRINEDQVGIIGSSPGYELVPDGATNHIVRNDSIGKEPIEIFNLKTGKTVVSTMLPLPKGRPAVYKMPNGQIFIFGGGSGGSSELREKSSRSIYSYDSKTNEVTFVDWLPYDFAGGCSIQAEDGDIYLFTEFGFSKFDYQKYANRKP